MQLDIGESTFRTLMPTLPEPAVVETRPLQLSPVFHHPHHHSPSTILSPSTNLQGWAWCGETQYPLTPFPSIHPPVQADKKSETEIQGRESEERNSKRRWKRKTQYSTSVSLESLSSCIWKLWGEVQRSEIEWRKIKDVEDSGKPVVVFSTNCDFYFIFILPCIVSVTILIM